jgi:hypothetical protein
MAIFVPFTSKTSKTIKSNESKMQDTINRAVYLSSKADAKSVKENARLQDYLWK